MTLGSGTRELSKLGGILELAISAIRAFMELRSRKGTCQSQLEAKGLEMSEGVEEKQANAYASELVKKS